MDSAGHVPLDVLVANDPMVIVRTGEDDEFTRTSSRVCGLNEGYGARTSVSGASRADLEQCGRRRRDDMKAPTELRSSSSAMASANDAIGGL